ncbi:MAG: sensor histidine kinase [Oscillospiraceae bacterium]|nr:sensor histidine kinase [Oscillospiraceae bacterium]
MARKNAHTPIFRGLSIVLSILFMWGFGITLLVVFMNISIGFAGNDAEFKQAFLERTTGQELDYIREYVQVCLQKKRNDNDPYLVNLKKRFDPQDTNLRFAATNTEGELLIANDPDYTESTPMMASSVQVISVLLDSRPYYDSKSFSNPLSAFSQIVYGDNSQYLKVPQEYEIWYFSDDDVDAAFHEGLDVKIFSDACTSYEFFRTEDDARAFDYTAKYGELVEWEITASNAVSPVMNQNAQNNAAAIPAENTKRSDAEKVVVTVQSYRSVSEDHISLEDYYNMKVVGDQVIAADPNLEEKLMNRLDITIRARKDEYLECRLLVYLPNQLEVKDSIRANYAVFHSLFRHGEGSVILMFVFMVLTVISCIIMCSAVGNADKDGVIRASRVHGIFYELFWLLPVLMMALSVAMMELLYMVECPYRMIVIFCAGMVLMIAASCVLWLYTTAIRAKMGTFWSSFGTYRLFRFVLSLFSNAPGSTVATIMFALLLFVLNGVVVPSMTDGGLTGGEMIGMFLILVLDLLALLFLTYCIYAYFELHKLVRKMETGDFTPEEHTVPLAGDFSRFDRSLTEITDRVGEIVARQTKAEHLRTELITNVSHDLKTPLTSIVNYVDLLSREPMQTETAAEYLEVLQRQAARLKKLTIDLVDASKASTGNLTVELVPTDVRVLLSQLAGEYEEQLAAHELTLVQNLPEDSVTILADGRQIWRVFDNLLNNACKYALTGTRVYLDVNCDGETAEITMKNISATPLNISADALMERFVRGDASRHTEGSGLGLSIARDLTTLQNGVLNLKTDGDLFKAILRFPVYHAPEEPEAETPDPETPPAE